MKSLFFRVLALLLGSFVAVLVLSFLLFRWVSEELHPGEDRLRELVEHTAEEVVEASEEGRLNKYKRKLHHRYRTRAWLLDHTGGPVSSPPVPTEILNQVVDYPGVIYPFQNTAGRFFIFSQAIERSGRVYRVILAADRPPPGGRYRGYVLIPIVVLLTLLIASALLSYWMLKPLQTLRNTTRAISADSLDTRLPTTLTQRRDAFGELGKEFNRMTDRVERSVESQKQLLRDVSHELRSPLARIQVAASLSSQKHGTQPEINRIEEEVERLDHLIEKLISLSRLQSQSELNRETVDLDELISKVVDDCNFEYVEDGRQAVFTCEGVPNLRGDSDLLSSAFENVIRNALRFSPSQGLVEVSLKRVEEMAEVNVKDHGPGVAPENLQRIFEPFYRGDDARDISGGQHGIGLAIAKTIINLHGGEITATNGRDEGLAVSILLPVHR
jgi:signal transduction histidine kinase